MYLKAIINESVKLQSPLPFLVPHMAMDSYKMPGYYKRNTNHIQCLCNWTDGIYGCLGYFLIWTFDVRLIPCPAMPAKCFVLVVEGKWVIKKGFEERERERERES